MKKVLLGMSGGIDSSTAAFILKKQGFFLTGITLKLWDEASRCCNYDDILNAKKICWNLGFSHYTINSKTLFKKRIVNYFVNEYLKGRTPNPCVLCNPLIKFKILIEKLKKLNFNYIATGHYAIIEKNNNKYFLKKGKDKNKTQEYFLAQTKKEDLKYIILPLGNFTKDEIKKIAEKNGITINRKESQEVCFLKDKETPYEFIKKFVNVKDFKNTYLYSTNGEKLKKLKYPYFKYTIGQRKGLNYSAGKPVYIVNIDSKNKKVIIGEKKEVFKRTFKIKNINILNDDIRENEFIADVKVRYLHKEAKAKVKLKEKTGIIEFFEKQFAITPGQLAVFYDGDYVLGSGFIEEVLE